MTTETLRTMKSQLPTLLKRLSKIKDHRNPKKIKYKLTTVLIYGILSFVLQMSSRREANREMTRPMFIENLLLYFPELKDLPHNDTLMRLLSMIEVDQIKTAHIELIRSLIRKKKFRRYLIGNCYPIAIDGTQKFYRDYIWSEECLERTINKEEGYKQYYVYVLEANLAFNNGMTIPLTSEILNYAEGDTDNDKQDCETRAFHRLAERLKKEFPRLPIIVLLDGLYANGPIME
ncbi:MAG: transposase family protein, partial [Desulfobacteraceae bacterium]|nr:transposase family protein [Desulfobacteraceae bacterium]